MSPEQTAGLAQARVRAMAGIDPDDDVYIADDQTYLDHVLAKWLESNPGGDVDACRERALNSWAGDTAPLPPDAPPLSPKGQKAALIAYAANKRWQIETGGITVAGVNVPTDDRAKLLLLGAAQSMADGTSAPLIVSGVNCGVMPKTTFQAINTAVIAHVQKTFASLATVLADIEAGAITTTAQIDAANW